MRRMLIPITLTASISPGGWGERKFSFVHQ